MSLDGFEKEDTGVVTDVVGVEAEMDALVPDVVDDADGVNAEKVSDGGLKSQERARQIAHLPACYHEKTLLAIVEEHAPIDIRGDQNHILQPLAL